MNSEIEKLLSGLTGYPSEAEAKAIETIASLADESATVIIAQRLSKSHWPVCASLAKVLACIGSEAAQDGLKRCLSARKHHIRTAAVEALASTGDASLSSLFEPLLADLAFETRIAAKEAITSLTGIPVKTARGE